VRVSRPTLPKFLGLLGLSAGLVIPAVTTLVPTAPALAQAADPAADPGDDPIDELLAVRDGKAPLEEMWKPAPRMSPDVKGLQVVGLETWLAIDPASWQTVTWERDGVEYSAVPDETVWQFSDTIIRCDGPGEVYVQGAVDPPSCAREWDHTTDVAPMQMAVWIEYDVNWTAGESAEAVDPGKTGKYVQAGLPLKTYDLSVGEIQSFGVDDADATPDDMFRPVADQVPDESIPGIKPEKRKCEGWSWFGCIATGDFEGAWDEAGRFFGDVIDGFVNEIVGDVDEVETVIAEVAESPAAKDVLEVLEGCVDVGRDLIKLVRALADEAIAAGTNPAGWLKDKLELIQRLSVQIAVDPVGFAEKFLAGVIDLDLLKKDPPRWLGKMLCEVALIVLTDGAIGGEVAAEELGVEGAEVAAEEAGEVGAAEGGAAEGGAAEGDAAADELPTCANSFPTGTQVLLADGSHEAIDRIRPGDAVLAADETTGAWSPRIVEDQWSHVDDGVMATVTLDDLSQITATDHHLFWVANDGAWIELDAVQPGDLLVTPDGVTKVADVRLSTPTHTMVWELDVAIDNTFAVHTGTRDVLVHNAECVIEGGEGEAIPGEGGRAIGDAPATRTNAAGRVEVQKRNGNWVEAKRPSPSNPNIQAVQNADGTVTYTHTNGSSVTYKDGFPVFDDEAAVDLHFDEDYYDQGLGNKGGPEDFRQANQQTAEAFEDDPEIFADIDEPDRSTLEAHYSNPDQTSARPPGYTWHHHQDTGRMQLVKTTTHQPFSHTGGASIWSRPS
jgi:DNase/tRNase domain of colicin-like bacteriocin/Pretoxin HINT domain